MTIGTIAISLWILSVIGYVIYNLFNKNKKLEDAVIRQQVFINDVLDLMKRFDALVNKIDTTIWVQSDPELLQLFDNIKEIQTIVNQYTSQK
jgi:hypothetical protein